ncbi:hypothetical protein RP20_CCG006083 [Aedes albopictus]|nr:hypothetical protein RP20_CCG006083 [Aedes albopictus]
MGRPSLDNSSPNLDDVDQIINSLWDEKPTCDVRDDQLTGIKQWLLDGAPAVVQEQSDKVTVKKDENAILKLEQDLMESPVNKSDATEKDQIVYNRVVLTPESSSSVWYDYRNFSTVDPVSSFVSNPSAEMMGYTHNQLLGPQVYGIHGADASTKQIKDVQQNYPGVVQNIKIEPLHELKPVQQACPKPAPSQVIYELPQTSSCMYVPGHRAPLNPLTISTNTENLETQQVQDFQAIAVPPTSSTCYEPISPFDSADPAPGMTCAEYFSSLQFATDDLGTAQPSSGNYAQVPPFNSFGQAATHSDRAAPSVQNIDQSASYAEVPNGYVLPVAGNNHVYPVQLEAPQPAETEKPNKKSRKAQIPYGTEFYCNICDKTFGRQSSFQQHLLQKHQETRPFRCDICGKSYLTEKDLREHRQNHDSSMKPHKCHSCKKSYRHMKDRDRHYETHHGTPSHVCVIEGCTKAFARRDHMMAHVVSHENRLKREAERAKLRAEKQNNRKQRRCEPREN